MLLRGRNPNRSRIPRFDRSLPAVDANDPLSLSPCRWFFDELRRMLNYALSNMRAGQVPILLCKSKRIRSSSFFPGFRILMEEDALRELHHF